MALAFGSTSTEPAVIKRPMQNVSLNARIIFYTIAVVTVTSALFAFGVLTLKNRLEQATFGDMVRQQMEYFLDSDNEGRATVTEKLSGWVFTNNLEPSQLPKEIVALPLGSHHSVQFDDSYYQIEVAEKDGTKFYLSYDITAWEEQEHQVLRLLAYGSLLTMALATFVAFFTARASLKPLHNLTDRLASIQPDQRDVRIASEFIGAEVQSIAREFDRYLKRLDEFVERERFVSAAASHELRTPLAIIMGAIDVLEANSPELTGSKPLMRIKRACDEMLAFIEVTLFLSREESNLAEQGDSTDLETLVKELVEELEPQLQQRRLTVKISLPTPVEINQRCSIVKMVVSNIVRNAIEHTLDGSIEITAQGKTLIIVDSGEGIEKENIQQVFERSYTTKSTGFGMGLTLAKKLADRLAWKIDIDSTRGVGTSVSIQF